MKIFQLLTKDQALSILKEINSAPFIDGKLSANGKTKEMKSNLEIDINNEITKKIINRLYAILINNEWLKNHYLPKNFSLPIINKYSAGDAYGRHIDNSIIRHGTQFIRADLSYTLMLTDSSAYSGGELNIETNNIINKVKLEAGQIIVYPSMNWHYIEKINSGERVACIGWIESCIMNNEAREVLSLWEDFELSASKENISNEFQLNIDYLKNRIKNILSKY